MSTTAWWVVGYAAGTLVVLIAATLLVAIILLARRIVRQARDIEQALLATVGNTESLFDLGQANHAFESLTRSVRQLRGEQGPEDERGILGRIKSVLSRKVPLP